MIFFNHLLSVIYENNHACAFLRDRAHCQANEQHRQEILTLNGDSVESVIVRRCPLQPIPQGGGSNPLARASRLNTAIRVPSSYRLHRPACHQGQNERNQHDKQQTKQPYEWCTADIEVHFLHFMIKNTFKQSEDVLCSLSSLTIHIFLVIHARFSRKKEPAFARALNVWVRESDLVQYR